MAGKCRAVVRLEELESVVDDFHGAKMVMGWGGDFGFIMDGDVEKVVKSMGLMPIGELGGLVYKFDYDGGYVCLQDGETCYSLELIRKFCADLTRAYAAPEAPLIAKAPGNWHVVIAPAFVG